MTAATFTWPVTAYYEDTDAAGVVYYANYLRYLERARTEWLAHRGHQAAELATRHGIVFVVAHLDIAYRAPARLGDRLQVGLDVIERGRARFILRQDVHRGDEVLVAARVTMACVEPTRLKPVRIPPLLLESLH